MLEKALISAVVHQREETVYRVHGAAPAALFSALASSNVNVDTILQSSDEIVFSAPPEDRAEAARTLDGLGARWEARDDLGKVSRDRRRHEEPSGRRREDLRDAGVGGHLAGRRLDVSDQDRLPHRVPPGRRRRARTPRCLRPRRSARIGVVGATGAVGTVTLELLQQRGFEHVRVFASARSAGKQLGAVHRRGGDARGARARRHRRLPVLGRHRRVPRARPARRAWRRARDRQVRRLPARARDPARRAGGQPGRALEHDGIVANPNCCTIPLTCVLKPLHEAAGLARVRVATYQSVSGAGAQSMERLRNEPQDEHDLRMDWDFDGEEFDEESKLRDETRKIMELPELPIQATCVRVPVMVGHAEAIWVETEDAALRRAGPRAARRGAVGAARGLPLARARRPGSTTCSSAGSAATRRSSAASRSSSRATTSARARR